MGGHETLIEYIDRLTKEGLDKLRDGKPWDAHLPLTMAAEAIDRAYNAVRAREKKQRKARAPRRPTPDGGGLAS